MVATALKASSSSRLLKVARKLDQNAQDEYAFLNNYKLKMIQCKTGETYTNPVNGLQESESVVFRLCDSECDNDAAYGCSTKYGDYVVGLNSFAQMYLEEKREDMQGDDDANNWDFGRFGECQQWDVDKDVELEEEEEGVELAFYVGPACTDDGTDVKIGLFTDQYCTVPSEKYTFEQISNGVSLPYSDGGLLGKGCESCYGANDRGEYELSEMCTQLYAYAGKCETNMETTHYMGKQEGQCEYISSLMPARVSKNKAGPAIGWTILALFVVGIAAFGYMQMKKKQDDKRASLMS
jgi:hypothetical protein